MSAPGRKVPTKALNDNSMLEEHQQRHQAELQTLRADIAAGKTSRAPRPADAVFSRLGAKYSSQTVDEPR